VNGHLQDLMASELTSLKFVVGTAEALDVALAGRADVHVVRGTLLDGSLTAPEIEAFVQTLMADFRRDEAFRWDVTLAALVVAMERWKSDCADTLIAELSRLRIVEMPMSARIARLVSQRRSAMPKTTVLKFRFTTDQPTKLVRPHTPGEETSHQYLSSKMTVSA
jgi:hypothetical protein